MQIKGIQYVSWWHDEYLSHDGPASLEALTATGANWAGVLTTWYQPTAKGLVHAPHPTRTPSDEAVAHAIRECHARDLRVMLKPHIDALDGSWRGIFQPQDTAAWFASYSEFLLHHARLAQRLEVAMLCIGRTALPQPRTALAATHRTGAQRLQRPAYLRRQRHARS